MSDPDASVKSIFSGKTVGEKEFPDASVTPRSPSQRQTAFDSDRLSSFPPQLDGRRPQGSPNITMSRPLQPGFGSRFISDSSSISSQNSPRPANDARLHPETHDFYDGKNNSTNISLISTSSDYQHAVMSDFSENEVQDSAHEPYSRPLSRNSVTSCLSTTATKDGIEGKRIPKPQFKLFDNKFHSLQNPVSSTGNSGSPSLEQHSKLRTELDSMSLPPISLNEKMQMMNSTAVNGNGQDRV